MKKASTEKFDVKKAIVDNIVETLEKTGTVWHKNWKCMGVPVSADSKKPYKGINFLILSLVQNAKSYKSNKWITFNQLKALNGSVEKGEKSTMITYYQMSKYTDKETGEEKTIPFLRYYNVFNIEQTTLKDSEKFIEHEHEINPEYINNDVEKLISSFDCAINYERQDRNYYSPSKDAITLTTIRQFENLHAYYSTALHEMAHATGHKTRLDRFTEQEKMFKSDKEKYAFEELVAELTSMFTLATYKVDNEAIKENNKVYIKGWLTALKSNSDYIFKASKYAQKAFEYITEHAYTTTENKELVLTA